MTKWLILHTILAGLLVALWFIGGINILWQADHVYAVSFISLLIGLGSLLAAGKKWSAVDWLAENLPSVGLVGTVAGLLVAAQVVVQNGGAIDEANRAALFILLVQALASNMMGIAGKLWLNLVERVCREG